MASVSIVNLSEVKQNGWRLDGEYWISNTTHNAHFQTLKELGLQVVSGPFGSSLKSDVYSNVGVPFLRVQDLHNTFLDLNTLVRIPHIDHERLKSSKLSIGDIALGKVGTIGSTAQVTNDIGECNISENCIGIRFVKNESCAFKSFCLVYLSSSFGQNEIKRLISGNIQPKLNVSDVYNLKLPLLTPAFQTKIEQTVKKAHELLEASKTAYKAAENLLLSEVFGSWKPATHKNWHVKMLSEVQSAGRMDAEYFHAKYEDLLAQIKSYKGGWCELGEVIKVSKGIEPGASEYKENGIPFVRVADLSSLGICSDSKFVSQEFFAENQKLQLQQGEILLSKDGTPGIAYYLAENPKKMLCSSGIIRLNVIKNFLPEVLTLLLNSNIVQPQIDREMNGALIKHWLVDQVSSTKLPIIPQPLQTQIAQLVKQSFEDRTQSKNLLHLAKTAVEKAIEEGEEVGIKELKNAH